MRVLSTRDILEKMLVSYEARCEEGVEPETVDIKFSDYVPELVSGGERSRAIADKNLYKHQYEGIRSIEKGRNVILISGTGSGKTETWAIPALTNELKVLAVYPTIALASDQINRIEDYYGSRGLKDKVIKVDRPALNEFSEAIIREKLKDALLVITNPAFLMSDLKRLATRESRSVLAHFLKDLNLIVFDEFDFYGSKGAALLIALSELMINHVTNEKPMIAILTATLGNPDEIADHLTRINSRQTEIIEGKAFKVRNCINLILGKDLEKIRREILKLIEKGYLPTDLTWMTGDEKTFRRYALSIVEFARSRGLKIPTPYFDLSDLLIHYVDDEGVTLVFTPSIRTAEKLARRVKEKLPENKKELIATHHHLISKRKRDEIESKARKTPPEIRIIITVRTLLQGIDIGNVIRIVHYGLPYEVREFLQREGRKGRRREISFTETIIYPITSWDKSIAMEGIEGVEEYIKLPLEKVYVIPSNKYTLLFKGLFKVIAGIELSAEEEKLLRDLNLIEVGKSILGTELVLNERGLLVWKYMNFYEYGPPYGIPRVIVTNGKKGLEPISRRDLVEAYQPGMIDYSGDAIVTEISRNIVMEIPISDINRLAKSYDFIEKALGHYEIIKLRWGERPNLLNDIIRGKLTPIVAVLISTPSSGFGEYSERPYQVKWILESSSRMKLLRLGDTIIPYYEDRIIELDSRTYGVYRDYTYGISKEVDPTEDLNDLIVGAAILRILLRMNEDLAISFRELNIEISTEYMKTPTLHIWEPEAAGIIEMIDWGKVREYIDSIKEPPKLWIPLLKNVSRDAMAVVSIKKLSWKDVLERAIKVLNYVAGYQVIKLGDTSVYLPKPSKDLNIVSLDVLEVEVGNERYYFIGKYDGEKAVSVETLTELSRHPLDLDKLIHDLMVQALDNNITVVVSADPKQYVLRRTTKFLIDHAANLELIVNPLIKLKELCSINYVTYSDLSKLLGIQLPNVEEIRSLIHKEVSREGRLKGVKSHLRELSRKRSIILYNAFLLSKVIEEKRMECFTQ
jgi:DEAD/DEAH box helicase domain-containing protein